MIAYLFDIDGVLTNPHNTDDVNPAFIPVLVEKLREGTPVGLISGRPLVWEITEVVEKMERYVQEHSAYDPMILDNLFVSGEFGNTAAIHVEGERQEVVYEEKAIPKSLLPKLEEAIKPFQEYAAFDSKKRTMFTVYSNGTIPLRIFQQHAKEIVSALQIIVGANSEFEVHEDQVAVNVKHALANKHAATKQFLQWLLKKDMHPSHFYAFGDSLSDLEIGKELSSQQLPFTFIFVGEKETIAHHPVTFPIVFTKKQYDEGTLEFLKQIHT